MNLFKMLCVFEVCGYSLLSLSEDEAVLIYLVLVAVLVGGERVGWGEWDCGCTSKLAR